MMIIKPLFVQQIRSITQLFLAILFLFVSSVYAEEVLLDKIAAVVNDDVIMVSEVRDIARQLKARAERTNTNISSKELIKKALDRLILEKIQVQRAKELGIKVDNVAVNRAMKSIAKQNNLNLEEFRIALQKEGIDYKEFRESIRNKLYIDILKKRQQQSTKKTISENEIDDLIKAESQILNKDVQYHIQDILVPAPNGISVTQFNGVLNKAQRLRKRLLINSNSLSQKHINSMGGKFTDLGWKTSQSLSPSFLRALSLMEVGELSSVVRDPKGFHILKLVEQRGGKRKLAQLARIRHILISADDPEAKVKVTLLRNKILAGESFSKVARENSADIGSAQNGGEMDFTDPTAFVPPFANAVRQLPLNTLSQPVKTRFGWHIIEVLERKTTDQTREALKNQAESLISEKKQSEEYKNWLQGLRDEAFVEYRI